VQAALSERLLHAAHSFRRGENGEANDALVGAIDSLVELLGNSDSGLAVNEIARVLRETLDAQSRGDLLLVADHLEHELVPLL
jgi:hypothetical protein